MIVKQMFFYLVCIFCINQPIFIFCMMEEPSGEEETFEKAISQPKLLDRWSKYIDETKEKFKKSFVFDTEKPEIKMIVIQTDQKTHFFKGSSKGLLKLHTLSGTFFDNVTRYIPIVYQERENYIFYVAKKKPALVFNEKYVVEKLSFRQSQSEKISPIVLFEHNTPIMYLGELEDGKYLVAGSFYPSIKIYDCKKGKVIKTLHNRFLLGAYDDTLYFAKKVEPRPYFGLGRLLDYELNKQYDCILCSRKIPFDTNKERDIDIDIEINKDHYPISKINGDLITILDTQTSELILLNKHQEVQAIFLNLDVQNLKIDSKTISIKSLDALEKYLDRLFNNIRFLNYIKSKITYENSLLFAEQLASSDVLATRSFLIWIFESVLKEIISDKSLAKFISIRMVDAYQQAIYKEKKLKGTDVFALGNSLDYRKIRKYIHKKTFKYIRNFLLDLETNRFIPRDKTVNEYLKEIQFLEPASIKVTAIKNMCVDTDYITVQTNDFILQAPITDLNSFVPCATADATVHNIYTMDSILYVIKEDGLYKIDLASWQKEQSIIAEKRKQTNATKQKEITAKQEEAQVAWQERQQQMQQRIREKEALQEEKVAIKNTRLSLIESTIKNLQLNESIEGLKKLFLDNDKFIITTVDNLLSDQRIDGAVYNIVKYYYMEPILKQWISDNVQVHIENSEYFNKEQKNKFIVSLQKNIINMELWLYNVYWTPIYEYIQKFVILDEENFREMPAGFEQYKLEENTQGNIEMVLKRFDSIAGGLQDYKKLKTLSVCLALETIVLNTDKNKNGLSIKRQTYMQYIQSILIKRCDLAIKGITFNTTTLFGSIFPSV